MPFTLPKVNSIFLTHEAHVMPVTVSFSCSWLLSLLDWRTSASNPMSSMASAICSGLIVDLTKDTLARPDMRETRMDSTPVTLEIVFSMLLTHEAHVIPPILSAHVSVSPTPLIVTLSEPFENEIECGTTGVGTSLLAGLATECGVDDISSTVKFNAAIVSRSDSTVFHGKVQRGNRVTKRLDCGGGGVDDETG